MSVVVAERELELEGEAGDVSGFVRVYAPMPNEDVPTWRCNARISWPGFDWSHAMHGIDSFQALLETLRIIPVVIQTSEDFRVGRLKWKTHTIEVNGRQIQSQTFDEAFGCNPHSYRSA